MHLNLKIGSIWNPACVPNKKRSLRVQLIFNEGLFSEISVGLKVREDCDGQKSKNEYFPEFGNSSDDFHGLD